MINTKIQYLSLLLLLTACGSDALRPAIELPGDDLFPESVAQRDGRLFVGSATSGEVLSIDPRSGAVEMFIEPGSVNGLLAGLEWHGDRLLACETALDGSAGALLTFEDGVLTRRDRFPGTDPVFCNDVAVVGGRVLVTESFRGRLFELRENGLNLAIEDIALAGTELIPAGANGIAEFGGGIVVSNTARGSIVAVDLDTGVVSEISVGAFLDQPDGLAVDGDRLLIAEAGAGAVGVYEPGRPYRRFGDLDYPSAVASAESGLIYAVESQIDRLRDPSLGPPTTPFSLSLIVIGD